ncbi:MAG: hypothetical protein EHM47_00970 [Ignavibacteriales bacterium]|nr:MAG: hypothetical protein EHM47_00970 [Ignavibacteriales bacterium]
MENETENANEKIIEKIEFYRVNEIKAHVFIIPKPKFKNGLFVSRLQPGNYFWFIENKSSIPIRLFLYEILDLKDYLPEEEMEEHRRLEK